MNHAGFITGLALGLWAGFFITFWKGSAGNYWGWRVLILVQLLPALSFAAGLTYIPESPRWLVSHGESERARAGLQWLWQGTHDTDTITHEFHAIIVDIESRKPSRSAIMSLSQPLLRDGQLVARLWRAFLLQFMAQMCGATAMKYYLPTLLEALGLQKQVALMAGAIEMTLKIGMTVVEMWIIDRFGRKACLVGGSLVMGSAMLINGALPKLFPNNMSTAADAICIVFIFIYAMGYSLGLGPAAWVYSSEETMKGNSDYETINRIQWDERAPLHAASPDYKIKEFISNPEFISEVVQFDRPLLGDISGLKCAHLQCHIGTDTLSLARLGTTSVTGLDFSSASLNEARKLAAATKGTGGERLAFVEASVYDSLDVLEPGTFDLVFTGIGALCWIPSVEKWAAVISGLLKPGGRLFIREGHPVLWSLDDENERELVIKGPYFEQPEPRMFDLNGTYVDTGGYEFKASKSAEFNHGIGEIIQALINNGMRISGMVEHQSMTKVGWCFFDWMA
ncbi:hypothetical protein K4F52_009259 [Lecanicillium sp. MT-2017a]|nr:hypothetical protein K4F52_009259 [Lecanicillium sp. MT-2017a]